MSQGYIIGLNAGEEPCAVCDVMPRIFKHTSIDGVIECGRCGLLSNVDLDKPAAQRIPWPAVTHAWLAAFRKYHKATGGKITAPHIAEGNAELQGRLLAMNKWFEANPEVVAQANIATQAPYTSVTAICALFERDGETECGWSLIVPTEGRATAIAIPVDPNLFAPGTIITIQTPVNDPNPPQASEAE